jgi:flagellar FliJ protein
MKPFRFRLARLLRLKLAEKRQRAIALGRALHDLDSREAALAVAQRQRDEIVSTYARLADAPSRPADWTIAQNALVAAQRRINERRTAVQQAEAKVEEARLLLLEQSREVEVYQRLRRKEWEEYSRDVQRAEQKEIDAVAGERFAQKLADYAP